MIPWQDVFSKINYAGLNETELANSSDLAEFRQFMDVQHIRHCLVKPWQEDANYPLVEGRELLPSFENDMFEHKKLPAFALVAFGRKLDYFSEIFQYDKLNLLKTQDSSAIPDDKTLRENISKYNKLIIEQNLQTLSSRVPKNLQKKLKKEFEGMDVTHLKNYSVMLPYLLTMDRAHVFSLGEDNIFHLNGVYASFPSDIDSELKRFGLRIGKFVYGDNEMYERNRMFVYQFFMELYGFPIVSERRTSSALFARKLHRMSEAFLLRVLGQTDRTITTYFYEQGENRRYPHLDKIALVRVSEDQTDAIDIIDKKGFFLDRKARVVIMRARYRQHRYDPENLRQDRALSVIAQEILHPLTGEVLSGLNIIKDTTNLFLRLNDIVRGEYNGRIVYKRSEVVENTNTDEKRLKVLYTWLNKHKRRMISYNDEFFNKVSRVLESYLDAPKKYEKFEDLRDLHLEVSSCFSYIKQARRAKSLQDIANRKVQEQHLTYKEMTKEAVNVLTELQFELANFFPEIVDSIIKCVESILKNRYMLNHYIDKPEPELSEAGKEIRKNYSRLVSLLDSVKGVRRSKISSAKSLETMDA